jgi:hypothetical protein
MSGARNVPTREALRAVALYAEVFSALGFSPGRWCSSDEGYTWFESAPAVLEFEQAAYSAGLVVDFDWPSWAPVGREIEADPERLAAADLDTVTKLLTVAVRSERFAEGHLAAAIKDGRLVRILSRLAVLATA